MSGLTNRQLPHLWYHGAKPRGKASNLFFEGDVIYSYGHHFPAARKVEGDPHIVLVNCDRYSATTGKHMGNIRAAIDASHSTVIEVPNVKADSEAAHLDNFLYIKRQLKEAAGLYFRARKHAAMYAERVERLCQQHNAYLHRFMADGGRAETQPEEWLSEGYKALLADQRETLRQQEKERKAQRLVDLKDLIAQWRQGADDHELLYRRNVTDLPPMLRVSWEKDRVETTHGASFPIRYAAAAWRKIEQCRQRNTDWHRNGDKVALGLYELEAVYADGSIKAGCHRVAYEESLYVATQLGLVEKETQA